MADQRAIDLALAWATYDITRESLELSFKRAVKRALAVDIADTLRCLRISDANRKRVLRGWRKRSVEWLRATSDAARELVSGCELGPDRVVRWSSARVNAPTKMLTKQQCVNEQH